MIQSGWSKSAPRLEIVLEYSAKGVYDICKGFLYAGGKIIMGS